MFALLGRLCCNYSARIDATICPLAVLLLVSCRICDKREDTAAISVDSSDKASHAYLYDLAHTRTTG